MHWIPGPEEHSARSSSRVRRGLLKDPPDEDDIKACVPVAEANILIHAAMQATAPLSTPEGAKEFNTALRRALMSPKISHTHEKTAGFRQPANMRPPSPLKL